jgi:hypothetical protein
MVKFVIERPKLPPLRQLLGNALLIGLFAAMAIAIVCDKPANDPAVEAAIADAAAVSREDAALAALLAQGRREDAAAAAKVRAQIAAARPAMER